MQSRGRINLIVVWIGLACILTGCFQNAGPDIAPTIAQVTAPPLNAPPVTDTPATLPPVPTVAAQTALPPPPGVEPTQPAVRPPPPTSAPVEPTQPPAPPAPTTAPIEPTQPPAPPPTTAPIEPTPFITPIGGDGFKTPIPTVADPASQGQPTAAPTTEQSAGGQGVPPPPALSTPTALPTDPPCTYTVQSGDTFFAIGRKLNVDPYALISANPRFSPNTLAIGDVITIPNCKSGKPITATPTLAPVVQGGAATVTKSVVGDVPRTYIIVAGDTLGKIASQFGVTVDELVKANNFANDRVILKIGQLIVIPNKQ